MTSLLEQTYHEKYLTDRDLMFLNDQADEAAIEEWLEEHGSDQRIL